MHCIFQKKDFDRSYERHIALRISTDCDRLQVFAQIVITHTLQLLTVHRFRGNFVTFLQIWKFFIDSRYYECDAINVNAQHFQWIVFWDRWRRSISNHKKNLEGEEDRDPRLRSKILPGHLRNFRLSIQLNRISAGIYFSLPKSRSQAIDPYYRANIIWMSWEAPWGVSIHWSG